MRPTGQIAKCFDEIVGDFLISDELRKASLLINGMYVCRVILTAISGTANGRFRSLRHVHAI